MDTPAWRPVAQEEQERFEAYGRKRERICGQKAGLGARMKRSGAQLVTTVAP